MYTNLYFDQIFDASCSDTQCTLVSRNYIIVVGAVHRDFRRRNRSVSIRNRRFHNNYSRTRTRVDAYRCAIVFFFLKIFRVQCVHVFFMFLSVFRDLDCGLRERRRDHFFFFYNFYSQRTKREKIALRLLRCFLYVIRLSSYKVYIAVRQHYFIYWY